MNADYPKRPAYFSHKFCRLLAKVALANDIGADCCWFLTVIAHTEDAKQYRGPVTFFNEQLMPLVGCGSVPALTRVRAKLISAGWLHHTPGTNRRAAAYWVVIPDRYKGLADGPVDEAPEEYTDAAGGGSSNEIVNRTVSRTVNRSGAEPLVEASNHLPCPNPSPIAVCSTAPAPVEPPRKPTKKKAPAKGKPARQPKATFAPMFDALKAVTGDENGGFISKVADDLLGRDPPYTPADVHEFSRRWRSLLSWATPDHHPRLTLGIVQKHIQNLRPPPVVQTAAPAPGPKKPHPLDDGISLVRKGVGNAAA